MTQGHGQAVWGGETNVSVLVPCLAGISLRESRVQLAMEVHGVPVLFLWVLPDLLLFLQMFLKHLWNLIFKI